MQAFRLQTTDVCSEALSSALLEGLIAFVNDKVGPSQKRELVVSATEESGKLLAGLMGCTHRDWLHIERLWVAEQARETGLGSKLMAAAEAEAVHRGCIGAYLNTYSFQARGFYEKLGYRVFGEIPDFPPGHRNLFLLKRF